MGSMKFEEIILKNELGLSTIQYIFITGDVVNLSFTLEIHIAYFSKKKQITCQTTPSFLKLHINKIILTNIQMQFNESAFQLNNTERIKIVYFNISISSFLQTYRGQFQI